MTRLAAVLVVTCLAVGCDRAPEPGVPRASGYAEATEVHVASRVPGRVEEVRVQEGDTVAPGDVLVVLSTTEVDLALRQAEAARSQARAGLDVLLAGARPEEVDQAEAQRAVASAEQAAAQADLAAAETEVARQERLVRNRAGAEKARDDAVARRDQAAARLAATTNRVQAADAALAGLVAGARPEEIRAARARVEAADAQIASLAHDREDATLQAPSAGVISSRLVEPGELVSPRQPLLVIIALDRAWVNAFVEAAFIPALRLDGPATVLTDAGDELAGRISFISPTAEFTPRNVQTSEERAKLVYRVKVSVDNREGVLKPGMPVEVRFTGAVGTTGR